MQLKKPRCSAKKKAGHSRLVLTDPIRQTGSLSRSNSKLHAAQVRLVFASTQGIFLGVVMVHRGQTISTLSSPNKLIGIDPIPRSPLKEALFAGESQVGDWLKTDQRLGGKPRSARGGSARWRLRPSTRHRTCGLPGPVCTENLKLGSIGSEARQGGRVKL